MRALLALALAALLFANVFACDGPSLLVVADVLLGAILVVVGIALANGDRFWSLPETQLCPRCFFVAPTDTAACPECGHVFDATEAA